MITDVDNKTWTIKHALNFYVITPSPHIFWLKTVHVINFAIDF